MTRTYTASFELAEIIVNTVPTTLENHLLISIAFARLAEMAYRYGHAKLIDVNNCVREYPKTVDLLANGLGCEPRMVQTFVEEGLVGGDDVMNAIKDWDWAVR